MEQKIKLTVIDGETAFASYGCLINDNPVTITFDKKINFINADYIICALSENSEKNIYLLEVEDEKEKEAVFGKQSLINDIFYKNHFVEYSGQTEAVFFNKSEESKYQAAAKEINGMELNSVRDRIDEIISRNDEDNHEIMTILKDMNSKLDEILYILKPKTVLDNSISAKSLFIGEEGIFFTADSETRGFDKVFIKCEIRDNSGFFNFGAVCSLSLFGRSKNGCIYKAFFSDMNTEICNRIIKFVFRRERELLKEASI